ncbi:MAG: hypothetical protein J7539_04315 [Niabella sp.]|nr:hypothetical protein [Niabella sp.]
MKKILIAAAALLGVIACSNKEKIAQAMKYDQVVMDHMEKMHQTLFAVQRLATSDSVNLQLEATKFASEIDSSAKAIKDLPDFNGNAAYRDAALKLADFYKSAVTGPYLEIGNAYKEIKDTAALHSKVDAIVTKLQQDESVADDDFIKQRNDFAAKNNFKIDSTATN